ncbi:FmdB family zinc ribbon protein [Nocardia sp. NPDC052566]|uniref:FmdB family zinc ribbon protein n=1 Tax=Nocardia sp. NPDC052566 TaxID=3364330 RepID=UPI0037C7ACF3
MPSYQFTCRRDCGSFERTFRMAEAPAVTTCPQCGAASRRCFGGALVHRSATVTRLLDATKRTADEPRVVGAPPARSTSSISRNPLHRKLPRY